MQYLRKIKWNNRLNFFLGFCFLSFQLLGQNRQDLSQKRRQLLVEIDQAAQLLNATKQNKKATLDQFYTIQRQIQQRQELIETLQLEIDLSNQSIDRTSGAINALQHDMERLELEYGEMARQAYRNKINDNKLLFIFSSEGLSDGLKRWRYIQQYDEYRKKQAGLILETGIVLTEKLNSIEIKKTEQQDLLTQAERQQGLLRKTLIQKDVLLTDLKKDEARISQLINRKKLAHRKLSLAIEKIISDEINSRVGNNRINTAPANKNSTKTDADAKKKNENFVAANNSFKSQKGKLSWPVYGGIITKHFGKQSHPIHKQVQITNNGIDIRVSKDNNVIAVHSGQVAGFQYVPGYQNTLIIQHGDYYSVYSNLEKVNVKKGASVRKNQIIGLAGKHNQNDYREVHLEIWKGKQRLNPSLWLK